MSKSISCCQAQGAGDNRPPQPKSQGGQDDADQQREEIRRFNAPIQPHLQQDQRKIQTDRY